MGKRYNIDQANIMLTAFAGGGHPLYWTGLRHPDVFCLVARNCNFLAGDVPPELPNTVKRPPVLIFYAEGDPDAIVAQGRKAFEFLKGKGLPVELEIIKTEGHERHPELAARFFAKHQQPARPSTTRVTATSTATSSTAPSDR